MTICSVFDFQLEVFINQPKWFDKPLRFWSDHNNYHSIHNDNFEDDYYDSDYLTTVPDFSQYELQIF